MHDAYAYTPEELASHLGQAQAAYLDSSDAERRALARELHDTVIQPLTSLVVSLARLDRQQPQANQLAEQLDLWKALAQEALDSLRSSLAGLSAGAQSARWLPLADALRTAMMPVLASEGIRLTVHTHDWPADLPSTWTTHLFLAVREALTNVEKHASASRITVDLTGGADNLLISVVDNGVGCHPEALYCRHASMPGHGLGISGIQDRIQSLGGEVHIQTAPGSGMRIDMRLPRPGQDVIDQLTNPAASPVTRRPQPYHVH